MIMIMIYTSAYHGAIDKGKRIGGDFHDSSHALAQAPGRQLRSLRKHAPALTGPFHL